MCGCKRESIEAWIARLAADGLPIEPSLGPEIRRLSKAGQTDLATRLMAYLTPIGILPAMATRLESIEGIEARARVMANTRIPIEGSPPEAYPEPTARFVQALCAEVGVENAKRVLAWNVHGLSPKPFIEERRALSDLGSIDAWLADFHRRQVSVLRARAADGNLWFEQKITEEVADFVEARPEILGGIREGDIIYVTKIPYDPVRYLTSKESLERRRLACHCPLAASSIVDGGARVPSLWCNCSAGYIKYRFDVVFGAETEAAVLDSALAGGELCRFAIKIPVSARKFLPSTS